MRIKTQIITVVTLAVLGAALSGVLAIVTSHRVAGAIEDHESVHPVIAGLIQLNGRYEEYLRNPSEPVRQQWEIIHGRLVNEWVPNLPTTSTEEKAAQKMALSEFATMKQNFAEVQQHIQSISTSTTDVLSDANMKRLQARMHQRQEAVTKLTFEASGLTLDRIDESIHLTIWSVTSLTLFIVFTTSFFGITVARRVTRRLQESISTVAVAANQMAATTEEQHRIASQQATAINETATTMEELSVSAQRSSEKALSVGETLKETTQHAKEGRNQVDAMIEEMARLSDDMGAIAQQIRGMSEQSSQIDQVSIEVKDIASQTNLLALNAAVEAVRAGEHGKGFAVVAQEIRKLADQSKQSAARIRNLVAESQHASDEAVESTDRGLRTLTGAVAVVENSGRTFKELLLAFEEITEQVAQIGLTAKQQSIATTQVMAAMDELTASATESEAGLEQTNTGIAQLKKVADSAEAML